MKAPYSMRVTLAGIVMLVRLEHPQNALLPMLGTPLGMAMLVSFLQ